jgi:hypothetical protein
MKALLVFMLLLASACSTIPAQQFKLGPGQAILTEGKDAYVWHALFSKYEVPPFHSGCADFSLCVTVHVCVKNVCQDVKNIVFDTGSADLRIWNKALNNKMLSALSLNRIHKHSVSSQCFGFAVGNMKVNCVSEWQTNISSVSISHDIVLNNSGMKTFVENYPNFITDEGENGILGMSYIHKEQRLKAFKLDIPKDRGSQVILTVINPTFPSRKFTCFSRAGAKVLVDTGDPVDSENEENRGLAWLIDGPGFDMKGLGSLRGHSVKFYHKRVLVDDKDLYSFKTKETHCSKTEPYGPATTVF